MTDDLNSVAAWGLEDSEPDFWIGMVGMALRMRDFEQQWWTEPDLSVLRRACAGGQLMRLNALWHRAIEDVCTGL